MTELAAVVAIAITTWAAWVLVRASRRDRDIMSLRYAALASVALLVVALIAGGLYLYSHITGEMFPFELTQQFRLIVLTAATLPAGYFLVVYYGTGFR